MKRYRSCGKRLTDSSQAVIYFFSRLRSNRHNPCFQWERATLPIFNHIPQTFSLSCAVFCRRVLVRKNSVALINVAVNFGYENFCFVIYFSKIFCQHFFPKFLFSKFFSKIFFQIFFPKFLFQIFFSKIFFF